MSTKRPPTTTSDSGVPVASDEHSLTVGPGGPTVLHDAHLVQKMQHFNRERVPERVVHAKGSGAHGFFEVPRVDFKESIIQAFADGIAHKPETAFGTVNADVLAEKLTGYEPPNFCTLIRHSPHAN